MSNINHQRILVVDDNQDAAEMVAALLGMHGHTTAVACDGAAGVRTAVSFAPDVVFLDIGMPGMDGYETARALRQAMGKHLRIIALTAWNDGPSIDKMYEAGFDLHLTKPASYTSLASALQMAVSST